MAYKDVISLENADENAELSPLQQMCVVAFIDECTASHQYLMAAHLARGNGYVDATDEYKQHLEEEREHADKWLKRLEQMGIKVKLDLSQIQDSGNKWVPITTSNIKEQLEIIIKAEDDAVAFYGRIIEAAREAKDWITNRLAKQLQEDECEHKTDLLRIYEGL